MEATDSGIRALKEHVGGRGGGEGGILEYIHPVKKVGKKKGTDGGLTNRREHAWNN